MMILSALTRFYRSGPVKGRVLRRLNAFVIASGILALPIFVGHSLVIPSMRLLEAAGLTGTLALALSMGAFLCAMAVAYQRLLRVL
jgi:hypothetical protein